MKQFLSSIICLFTITYLFSQSPEEDFDRAFLHIYMHTASENVTTALQAADSLYYTAKSDIQKVRSLMLISDMFHRMANRDSSIHYAIKAERIAERTKNHLWQARICGVLSTQHRETGLFSIGRQYVEKGLKVIAKVDNLELANQFKGQCFQEFGFYAIEEKQYRNAIIHFKQAEPFFIDLTDSTVRYFALSQNDERLGLCYVELNVVDSAKFYYGRALALEHKASEAETPMKGFIYNGLGRVHLAEHQYEQADSCFQRALAIAETSGFPNLKISVYKNLAYYYQLTGNEEGYHQYNEKYLKENEDNAAKHKKYADNMLVHIQRKVTAMAASTRTLSLAGIAFVILAGLGMGVYVHKQRKNHQRYKRVIDRLRREKMQLLANERVVTEVHPDRDKALMPESTKQELLRKLGRFESSQQFTERSISMAVLAGKMKTNTKYLSYIINNYRNKDFNSYINELRVNYIISKMGTDNRYLNYKISYLAEECGFATHSQFTTVFRNITGLSPSTFVTYLKKDDRVRGDGPLVN